MGYRENFFRDYEAVRVPGKDGRKDRIRYEYVGDWCEWDLGADALARRKRLCAGLTAAAGALALFAGTRRNLLNVRPLLAVPGLAALAALIFAVIGAVQFCRMGARVPLRDRTGMNMRVFGGHVFFFAAETVYFVGSAALLLSGAVPAARGELLSALSGLLAAALSFCALRNQRALRWHEEPGTRSREEQAKKAPGPRT